ncbi:MAG: glycoside hydrolase family 9 protein [Actinomycetota bacterium]
MRPNDRPRHARASLAVLATALCATLLAPAAASAAALGPIQVSQFGYAPGDPMSAVLAVPTGTTVDRSFRIVDAADTTRVVHTSSATAATRFAGGWIGGDLTGDTWLLDFTAANLPAGRYRVESNGGLSAPFAVAADAYDPTRIDPLAFFRIQRAGVATTWTSLDGTTGSHGPDHLDDARQATRKDKGGGDTALIQQDALALPGGRLDVSGGWADAGDYNAYMGNTPWAAYLLLLTAEQRPTYWAAVDDDRDGVADIRQVVRPALEWMLKMQHADGSVYERVFNGYAAAFDGRPDLETDGVAGTADDRPLDTDRYADITAKAVYAWAAGARVLGDARYLDAARRAWSWASANPTQVKPKVYGGGLYFGDLELGLTIGALELHRAELAAGATPDPAYLTYALGRVRAHLDAGDWTEPSSWDYQESTALMRAYDLGTSTDRTRILNLLRGRWDAGIAKQAANAYRFDDSWIYGTFGQNENSTSAAGDALWLFARTGDRKYYGYAVEQLAWVFGRNPFGESWLATARATEYTRIPHWRGTAKHPIEGVVVPGATDRNGNRIPDYTDTGDWFYSEPTINQQAMFARVLTELFVASGGTATPPGNVGPAVTITSPTGGATVSGTITVAALASDADGVASVAYRVDGGTAVAMTRTGASASDPWQANLATAALADGTHTITVVATDGTGLQTTPSVAVQVRNTTTSSARVGRIDVALLRKGGSRYQARCDVSVVDAFGVAVPGATVTGHWSGAATDTFSVTTDANGKATDYSNSSSAPSGSRYTCWVDGIARSGWTYDAAANAETSDGVSVP